MKLVFLRYRIQIASLISSVKLKVLILPLIFTIDLMDMPNSKLAQVSPKMARFPACIVWTPIPMLTWLIPVIGHMGIATSVGVIRDFAGPYFVSEDNMAFGQPTKYWQLNPSEVRFSTWDQAVNEASEEYKHHMHNLLCDNCHSHVALALNIMQYGGKRNWNMVKVWFLILIYGKYVSFGAFLKTWLPFLVIAAGAVALALLL